MHTFTQNQWRKKEMKKDRKRGGGGGGGGKRSPDLARFELCVAGS